jgi:uncharacterized cofD-like protein
MARSKVVVIGGGTGAPVSIRTLLDMGCDVSSIVSMVDDGGSTGILRERGGVVPPGDIRKCIGAMSANYDGIFARAFRHRFSYLDNHSLGNLILTAVAEETNSFPDAIRVCENLIEARGHVYPSTLHDVTLSGMTDEGEELEGQAVIGDSDCHMRYVTLHPADAQAYPPALEQIRNANLIVLGPGSLFTSIIPNLLVPGVVEAIKEARERPENPAYTLFVCSLADMQGETWGMNCYQHVDAVCRHGMRGILDIALIHRNDASSPMATGVFPALTDYSDSMYPSRGRRIGKVRHVEVSDELIEKVKQLGVQPMVRDLVDPDRPTWHDRTKLAKAFQEVLTACHSQQR